MVTVTIDIGSVFLGFVLGAVVALFVHWLIDT